MNRPEVFPPVSEEHAAAIGYVAIQWSAVEMAVKHLIGSLLRLPPPAHQAVTAELPLMLAADMITVLLSLTGNAVWIKGWNRLRIEFERLRPLRNDAIHSEWQASGDEHYMLRFKAKGARLTVKFQAIPTKDLDQLADDCLSLAENMAQFYRTVLTQRAPDIVLMTYPPGQPQPPFPFHTPKSKAPSPGQTASRPRRPKKLSSAQKRAKRDGAPDDP